MRAGALGCEIIVKGKLSSRRGRYQKFKQATVAKTGAPADLYVDDADDTAILKPGAIGVKVRIMQPDAKLPGVIVVKKPKPKKPAELELLKPAEEEGDVVSETADIEERLEGITDLEELRELEELDGLELVEDVEATEEKKAPEKAEAAEPEEKPPKTEDESLPDEKSTLEELKELDELDTPSEGGE